MTTRLFVYGSLRRGEANHAVLGGARLVKEDARTAPGYALYDLGPYPGMITEGHAKVTGDVYELDDAVLAAVDRFEEHPHLFQRGRVELEDGTSAETYYVGRDLVSGRPRIPSGAWRGR